MEQRVREGLTTFKKTSKMYCPAPSCKKLNASSGPVVVAEETNCTDVRRGAYLRARRTHEKESQIEVSQGCPGEEELDGVVDEFKLRDNESDLCENARTTQADLEDKHPDGVLARRPDTPEKDSCVHRGEEGTVQPAATLRDELRYLWPRVSEC